MQKNYVISETAQVGFNNNAAFCVGTGRMGLALQKEYCEQLSLVQREVGFSYIRGHGIFCDDMAIYNEYVDTDGVTHTEYNFTYLDRVLDMYMSLNIKPFIELGFMPEKLASGKQTIFYWKGNTTPPKNYDNWAQLVKALLFHVIDRYGIDEVSAWPVEVWNEPNLSGFWENADLDEYKKLYKVTAIAVKEVSPRIRVGGPSVCGLEGWENWIRSFLGFCLENDVPLDFVTRHVYVSEMPLRKGRYTYQNMRSLSDITKELNASREIIDSFDTYRGMEMHITEFNTSYNPNCPIHDTNMNAAYIAALLAEMGDTSASYSYWTFGDVFEEAGVPFTPFHGGFGLVANGCIPKPTFWTFAFFKGLTGTPVHRSENMVVTKSENGYRGVCWNLCAEERETLDLNIELPFGEGEYVLITKTVDEENCNPLKAWHDLGEPPNPTKKQLELILSCSKPLCKTHGSSDGKVSLQLQPNAVIYFEFSKISMMIDRGYDYNWYIK